MKSVIFHLAIFNLIQNVIILAPITMRIRGNLKKMQLIILSNSVEMTITYNSELLLHFYQNIYIFGNPKYKSYVDHKLDFILVNIKYHLTMLIVTVVKTTAYKNTKSSNIIIKFSILISFHSIYNWKKEKRN